MRWIGVVLGITAASVAVASEPGEVTGYGGREVRGAFLALGGGARPAGMGGAFTAIADDASAGSWNPGGLGQLESASAVAMYDSLGADRSLSYLAGAAPAAGGVVGAAVSVMSYGNYEVRDDAGRMLFTDSLTDVAASVSWAVRNPPWLGPQSWTGISLEMVKEGVGGSMVAGSLGGIFLQGRGLAIGWALQHVGAKTDGFGLPAAGRAGAAYALMASMRIAADLGYLIAGGGPWGSVGLEWTPFSMVAIRCGYKWQSDNSELGGMTGVAAGGGIRLGGLRIDYAYQPFGSLPASHRVALVVGLPRKVEPREKTKEEPSADRRNPPSRASIALDLQSAMELHQSGRYREALDKARGVVAVDPDQWLGWQIIGNSLYRLGDRNGALEAYDRSLSLHSENPQLKEWMEKVRKE